MAGNSWDFDRCNKYRTDLIHWPKHLLDQYSKYMQSYDIDKLKSIVRMVLTNTAGKFAPGLETNRFEEDPWDMPVNIIKNRKRDVDQYRKYLNLAESSFIQIIQPDDPNPFQNYDKAKTDIIISCIQNWFKTDGDLEEKANQYNKMNKEEKSELTEEEHKDGINSIQIVNHYYREYNFNNWNELIEMMEHLQKCRFVLL